MRLNGLGQLPEEIELPFHVAAARGRRIVHHALIDLQQLRAVFSHGIEGACRNEGGHGFFAQLLVRHAFHKIRKAGKAPIVPALGEYIVNQMVADALDGHKAKADAVSRHGKALLALVDVGRQNGNAHLQAGPDVLRHLI